MEDSEDPNVVISFQEGYAHAPAMRSGPAKAEPDRLSRCFRLMCL
ncbi:MAG: hypothetical protein HW388_72 [Dehalococcoidia bacterium]|nr:hypothetical protein [Dehalococcoidia bacterium]